MDQFIQYLYEYEGGERVRNLGFMKLEKKMDKIERRIKTAAEIEKMFRPGDELSAIIEDYQDADNELGLSELELISAARHMGYTDFLKRLESNKDIKQ